MSIPYAIGEVVTELKCRCCDSQMPADAWLDCFGDVEEVVARDEHGYWSWNCGCDGKPAFCHLVATKPHTCRECCRPEHAFHGFHNVRRLP
jgi:hypothetical protein